MLSARLREALDDSPDKPRFVETLPRRGYRFIAPVTVAETHSGTSPDRAKNSLRPIWSASGSGTSSCPLRFLSPWQRRARATPSSCGLRVFRCFSSSHWPLGPYGNGGELTSHRRNSGRRTYSIARHASLREPHKGEEPMIRSSMT